MEKRSLDELKEWLIIGVVVTLLAWVGLFVARWAFFVLSWVFMALSKLLALILGTVLPLATILIVVFVGYILYRQFSKPKGSEPIVDTTSTPISPAAPSEAEDTSKE